MTRSHKIALSLLALALVTGILFYIKTGEFSIPDTIKMESFVRNNTWQTEFQKSVPYKK